MTQRVRAKRNLKRLQYESHMVRTDKKLRSKLSKRNKLLSKTYKIQNNKRKKRKKSKFLKSLSLIPDDYLHQILESLTKNKGPRSQMFRTLRNSKMPFSLRHKVVVIKMTCELQSSAT